MNVCENWNLSALPHFRKNGKPLLHAHPTETGAGTAVRLVEAGLVHEGNTCVGKNFFESSGYFQRMHTTFYGARTGYEKKRQIIVRSEIRPAVEC